MRRKIHQQSFNPLPSAGLGIAMMHCMHCITGAMCEAQFAHELEIFASAIRQNVLGSALMLCVVEA